MFSILTGLVGSLAQLIGIRILFGLGEAVHPPAAFKAALWTGRYEAGFFFLAASGLLSAVLVTRLGAGRQELKGGERDPEEAYNATGAIS